MAYSDRISIECCIQVTGISSASFKSFGNPVTAKRKFDDAFASGEVVKYQLNFLYYNYIPNGIVSSAPLMSYELKHGADHLW